MQTKTLRHLELILNFVAICGITTILAIAFFIQFDMHELPCPLCILQRIGFILIGFGFLLNLRFGFRPSHYAVVIFSALFTAAVALRQICLHIVPGTGSYGSAILGFHDYTWSFIFSVVVLIGTTVLLAFDRQYQFPVNLNKHVSRLTHIGFALYFMITIASAVITFVECGPKFCPDNPTSYYLAKNICENC